MEKQKKEKISKPLLPLILLLMLVILLTVIASNLKPDSKESPFINTKLTPDNPPSTANKTIEEVNYLAGVLTEEEILIRTAIKKYRLGEINDAESDFRTILVFDPDNQAALSYLGTIFYTQKKYREAELLFRRKVKVYPGNPNGFRNLALTVFHLGKVHEALENMNRAYELTPTNKEILLDMARLQAFAGDMKKAEYFLNLAKAQGVDISIVLQENIFHSFNSQLQTGKKVKK